MRTQVADTVQVRSRGWRDRCSSSGFILFGSGSGSWWCEEVAKYATSADFSSNLTGAGGLGHDSAACKNLASVKDHAGLLSRDEARLPFCGYVNMTGIKLVAAATCHH